MPYKDKKKQREAVRLASIRYRKRQRKRQNDMEAMVRRLKWRLRLKDNRP